jgi:hypothetical protein
MTKAKAPAKRATVAKDAPPKGPTQYDTFKEWFAANLPAGISRYAFAKTLAAKSGGMISQSTIMNTLKGQRLSGYAKGKALADLTNGAVALERIVDA